MTLYPHLIDDNSHDHRPPILSVIYQCNLCPFETKGSKISNEDNSALWGMQDHVNYQRLKHVGLQLGDQDDQK